MNILQASNYLFEWYTENNSINFKKDFKNIFPDMRNTEENLAVFSLALEEMEKNELIASKGSYWVLKRPFDSFEQSVKISPATALSISQLVNGFCRITGSESDYCDAADIKSKDIENIIIICTHLLNEQGPENDEGLDLDPL